MKASSERVSLISNTIIVRICYQIKGITASRDFGPCGVWAQSE